MSEAPAIVATLTRQWNLPTGAAADAVQLGSAVSLCRWRHTTREIEACAMPANTLVLMRNDGPCFRHRGRTTEPAPARRGRMGLLPEGSYGRWTFPDVEVLPTEVFHLYFPQAHLDKLAAQQGDGRKVELSDRLHLHDPRLQLLMREADAALDLATVDRLYIEGLALAISARLMRDHNSLAPIAAERGGLAPWQLRRAIDAIDAHLGEDIGLDMLAEVAGCSPTHFSRAFKQSTGVAPFKWLLERRIARAQEMLAEGRLPLAEVALALGFSAQPQFTTAFRRATGSTPGAWRRERRT